MLDMCQSTEDDSTEDDIVSRSNMSNKRKRCDNNQCGQCDDEQMDTSRMDTYNQLRYLKAMATVRYTALECHKSVLGRIKEVAHGEFSDHKKIQLIRTLLRSLQL